MNRTTALWASWYRLQDTACFRWLWINYWVRDPALYHSAIYALMPPFKMFYDLYLWIQCSADCFYFFSVNNIRFLPLWYRDKSEALATKTEIGVSDKVETFPDTTLCHIVISDAAPCQMSLKMAFTFNGWLRIAEWLGVKPTTAMSSEPGKGYVFRRDEFQAFWYETARQIKTGQNI